MATNTAWGASSLTSAILVTAAEKLSEQIAGMLHTKISTITRIASHAASATVL